MSAGRYVFFFFFLLFGCSAMMLLSGVFTETPPTVSTGEGEVSEIRQQMEIAHSRDTTLFQYRRDVTGMALCSYTQWITDLDANVKEITLTQQERANLTLCKYDPETGDYYKMQDVPNPQPGDYFVWEDSGLRGLRYK